MSTMTITTTAGGERVSCQAGQTLERVFTVTNPSVRTIRVGLEPRGEGNTPAGWLRLVGEVERDIPSNESQQVTLKVSVPTGTAPGEYTFLLRAYLTDDPEQVARSPTIAVQVPAPAVPPPPPPPPDGGPRWWPFALVGALIATAVGVGVWYYLTTGPSVPALVDRTLDEAVSRLDAAGLTLGTVSEKMTGAKDAGVVLEQRPEPGAEAQEGTPVHLTIEAVSVAVPSLVGQGITEAAAALTGSGLSLGAVTKQPRAGEPGGKVLGQDPAAGSRVLPNTPVTLTVVDEVIRVPSVIGQTYEQAGRLLATHTLRLARATFRRTGATPGVVLSHIPAAGETVAPGTAVELVLEEKTVQVPRLVQQTQEAATRALQASGLRLGSVSFRFTGGPQAGTVISQSPEPGTQVAEGTAVSLQVERAKITVFELEPRPLLKLQPGVTILHDKALGTLRAAPPADTD